VPALLSPDIAKKAIAAAKAGKPAAEDTVSSPFWRLLLGFGPPRSEENRMYEAEVAQVIIQSTDPQLRAAARDPDAADRGQSLAMLQAEDLSWALRRRLETATPPSTARPTRTLRRPGHAT
jgi:hypothetical protein